MHKTSSLYLEDLIAQIQLIRAQYGNLQIWTRTGDPTGPRVTVEDMMPLSLRDPVEKVVFID